MLIVLAIGWRLLAYLILFAKSSRSSFELKTIFNKIRQKKNQNNNNNNTLSEQQVQNFDQTNTAAAASNQRNISTNYKQKF